MIVENAVDLLGFDVDKFDRRNVKAVQKNYDRLAKEIDNIIDGLTSEQLIIFRDAVDGDLDIQLRVVIMVCKVPMIQIK